LSGRGINAVITGNVGPKAAYALEAARIKIYSGSGGAVEDALQKYQ